MATASTLVDHIADEIAATFDRYGKSRSPSTRYKDLVDLTAIATAASVEAPAQIVGLRSETKRRSIESRLPSRFQTVKPGKRDMGGSRALAVERSCTLEEALKLSARFADPLLDDSARHLGSQRRNLGAGLATPCWVRPAGDPAQIFRGRFE